MIGWLAKKSLSPAALRQLPAEGGKGGEAPLALGRTEDTGDLDQGGFQQKNCAIWNDIQRALQGTGK